MDKAAFSLDNFEFESFDNYIKDNKEDERVADFHPPVKNDELRPKPNKMFLDSLKGTDNKIIENDSKSKLIKEIIIVKDSQVPVIKYYLDSLDMKGFRYYESTGTYKFISDLKENLLNDPYWLVATIGKGNIHPSKKESYNEIVLKEYLNHIIITSNWALMDKIDKEKFTIDLTFGNITFPYKVRFLSTLPMDILKQYIDVKLGNIFNPFDLDNIHSILLDSKTIKRKDLVENTNKVATLADYPISTIESILNESSNISYRINYLISLLCLKKKKKWKKELSGLIDIQGENYILTSIKNGVDDLINLKRGKELDSMSAKYFKSIVNSIDLLDLILLRYILRHKRLEKILLELDTFINTPSKNIILKTEEV